MPKPVMAAGIGRELHAEFGEAEIDDEELGEDGNGAEDVNIKRADEAEQAEAGGAQDGAEQSEDKGQYEAAERDDDRHFDAEQQDLEQVRELRGGAGPRSSGHAALSFAGWKAWRPMTARRNSCVRAWDGVRKIACGGPCSRMQP